MMTRTEPQITELDPHDVHALLTRHYVGRIAFGQQERLEIRPVHYVYSDGRIYGRTSPGVQLAPAGGQPMPVVFEIDEVESMFRWRSVLARGELDLLDPEGPDHDEWAHAVALLRRLHTAAFRESDPVPHRTLVFRIVVSEVSGRAMY